MVDAGFLSPQIRRLDLSPVMTVQLYLETPQLFIQGDGQPLMFHIKGQVEADVLGGMVTDKLPVQITGVTRLKYVPGDQAIYFDQIDFMEAQIDLKVALFKTMIIDRFQQALLAELANMPLIVLANTPELDSVLTGMAKNSGGEMIRFESRDGNLMVEAMPERR